MTTRDFAPRVLTFINCPVNSRSVRLKMRGLGMMVVVFVVAAALVPAPASAALLAAYDLVGTDPSADAVLPFVTGVNWPACGTGFGCDKYDVRTLEMGADEEKVHFKLNVGAAYWGTGGILYAVHFTAAGKKYYTCWTIQSVGTSGSGTSVDVAENTLGCSRFTGETQVGPALRADGVDASTAAGKVWVRWEVAKSAIGGSTEFTDIVTEIWARGVSTCCATNAAGSQSQQLWNIADRGPNTGTWLHSLVKAPDLALNLTAEPAEQTVGPAGTAMVNVGLALVGNGSANVTLTLEGLPEGWMGAFGGDNFTLDATVANATTNLTVTIPEGAENQTVNVTILADAGNNVTANTTITIIVDTTIAPPAPSEASGNATTNATTEAGAAEDASEGGGIPGLGFAAVTAIAAFVVWRRRR